MRVIAGIAKGRKLKTPKGGDIRPTSDRVREALFSILGDAVFDAKVLDLYAGTGALGIEALSRGASDATFVDEGREAISLIHENLALACFTDKARVVKDTAGGAVGEYCQDQISFLEHGKNRIERL